MRGLVFIVICLFATPFLATYRLEFVSFLLVAVLLESERLSLLQKVVVPSLPLFMLLSLDLFSVTNLNQFSYEMIILGASLVLGIHSMSSESTLVKQASFFYLGLSFYFNLSVNIDFISLAILTTIPIAFVDRKLRSEAVFYILALYINNIYAMASVLLYLFKMNFKLPSAFVKQRSKLFYDLINYLAIASVVYSIKDKNLNLLIFFIISYLVFLIANKTNLSRAVSKEVIDV